MASQGIVLELRRPVRRRLIRLSRSTRNKTVFRRCQIILLRKAGDRPEAIASALACSGSTVNRTLKAFRERGEASLLPRASPGRPRTVTPLQDRALERAVGQEPRAAGQDCSNWTAAKLAGYLKLAVHPTTVLRHLWRLGWRWRRPVRRVASPDPRYRPKARYLRRLEWQARRGAIRLYYADEVDLALLPTLSGRWTRIGQQPRVDTPGQNQKQYGFGAANFVTGQLIWLLWPNKNNVGFRQLLKAVLTRQASDPIKVVMVVDNYRIHTTKAVKHLLAKVKDRLRLYFLPTYAPQLNPLERVWRHFRRTVTDNVYFKSMKRLLHATVSFFTALARTPAVIQSIFSSA